MARDAHHRPEYADPVGQLKKTYHLEMVSDRQRTGAILRALRHALNPDTVFCELGCGTGVFSLFAAQICKKVYAVEIDPKMVEIAGRNFARSEFSDKIELIKGNAGELTLPEKADVIFCEMMSVWCVDEPQIPVFNHAFREILKPGGLFLPTRIINLAELGFFKFNYGGAEMKAAIPLFTGIPRLGGMTERRVCRSLDFSTFLDLDLSCMTEFMSLGSGTINCAMLTSIVQIGLRTIFSGSDSLMPQTLVPLVEPLEVGYGERLQFQAAVKPRMDLNEADFSISRL